MASSDLVQKMEEAKARWQRHLSESYASEYDVKDGRESLIFHKGFCNGVVAGIELALLHLKDEK